MDVSGYYKCEPQYEEMDGWKTSIQNVRTYEDLPANAKKYLKRIEELVGAKIDIISTGPDRASTIILHNPFR
jgi:adenylosuccinate synthase